jgi:hypothetical protein
MNKALAAIRESEPDLLDDELAFIIAAKAKAYKTVYDGVPITPTALAKHWAALSGQLAEMTKPQPVNAPIRHSECPDCGGDKMVVVAVRKIEGGVEGHEHEVEEVAPCPTCNGKTDTTFWRRRDEVPIA